MIFCRKPLFIPSFEPRKFGNQGLAPQCFRSYLCGTLYRVLQQPDISYSFCVLRHNGRR